MSALLQFNEKLFAGITGLHMKRTDEFLSTFDKRAANFSKAWKRARANASEKSIHQLRVSARRLLGTLELTHALSRRVEIAKLQRRFQEILKTMGPLRDLQVQLEKISEMRRVKPIADFRRFLERRERREISAIRKKLKRGARRRFSEEIEDIRLHLVRQREKSGPEKLQQGVARVLRSRRNEFLKAKKRFKPADDDTLHEMRIALKKLRYAVEAARPVLGESATQLASDMRAVQQLLGDARDVQLLHARLEKWAGKRGKKVAIVPALESLREKRELLMQKVVESAQSLDNLFTEDHLRPAVEKTLAVAVADNTQSTAELTAPVTRQATPAGR
jgi:CHAD domain-containing protein